MNITSIYHSNSICNSCLCDSLCVLSSCATSSPYYGGVSCDCLALWISQPLLGVGSPINLRNYTRLRRDSMINHVLWKIIGVPRQFKRWPVRKSPTNMLGHGVYERTTLLYSYAQSCDCQPAEVTDYPVVYITEAYTDIRRNNMPKQGPDLMHNRPVRNPIDPRVSLWWGIKPDERKENTILNMSRLNRITFLTSGPRLNIKTVLSTYGDFHVKDKTAVRTSYL